MGFDCPFPIARSIHLNDRNRQRPRVVDAVMRSASRETEAALRRLLVGLERPAQLNEWSQRARLETRPQVTKAALAN
jgi:P2-related tail formation protein